jgi:hypothetical protein
LKGALGIVVIQLIIMNEVPHGLARQVPGLRFTVQYRSEMEVFG